MAPLAWLGRRHDEPVSRGSGAASRVALSVMLGLAERAHSLRRADAAGRGASGPLGREGSGAGRTPVAGEDTMAGPAYEGACQVQRA